MDPLSRLSQSETFFHPKDRPKTPFCEHRMAMMDKVFDGVLVKKNQHFFVNFQHSEFVCFWSVSRESVKELIYQKKNGGHQASKRVISM